MAPVDARADRSDAFASLETIWVDAEVCYRAYLAHKLGVEAESEQELLPPLPSLGETLRLPGLPVHAFELRWTHQSRDQGVIDAQAERAQHAVRYDGLFAALQDACQPHPNARMRMTLSVAYACALDCCNLYYFGVPQRVRQVFLGAAHGLCLVHYGQDGRGLIDALPLWARKQAREARGIGSRR